MNAKILILALCAFQLAAGGIIDSFITGPLALITAPINALLGSVQGQAGSIQDQFQNFFQSFNQNVTSQLDSGLSDFQQYYDSLNGSSQADACKYNQTQQYYSIGNATLALFSAGISILNETIRNSSKILLNVSSSLQKAIPQAISNFTSCLNSNNGLFSSFIAVPTCGVQVASKQFAAFANTANTQIQSTQKILNQLLKPSSINSTVHTLPQMVDLAGHLFLTVGAQIAAVNQQALQCIAQALNSNFAGAGFGS